MNVSSLNAFVGAFLAILFSFASAEEEDSSSPFVLPFELPQWLIPDYGGVLPFFPSDRLTPVDCPQEVQEVSKCGLPGDSEGVFVCRSHGLVKLGVCTPLVMTNQGTAVLGLNGDECGCCGEACPQACSCECNDGKGVMLETFVVRWWHVRLCVPKLWASYVTPLRKEIKCGVC